MRLSDAIMMGRVYIEKPNATDYCGCAIGMGLASLIGEQLQTNSYDALNRAYKAWPFLGDEINPPHEFLKQSRKSVEGIISMWFCFVQSQLQEVPEQYRSLESLCDWVRSIESAEDDIVIIESTEEVEYASVT